MADPPELAPGLRSHLSVKWSACPSDVLPAWVAEMDYALAEPVRAAVRRVADASDLGYTPREGDSGVEQAAAAWYASAFGWTVDPERVVLLPDVMRGIELAIEMWTGPGEGVVVMTPAYPPFLEAVAWSGRRLVDVPLRRHPSWEPDLDGIEAALREGARLVVLCNPHNPTGRVFGAETVRAVGRLAVQYGALLVADEVHAPLVLDDVPHVPVASLSDEIAAHTLTLSSVSKGWNTPGLCCAFGIAGSAEMRQRFRALPSRATVGVSIPGIAATVAALTEGGPWLDGVLAQIADNRHLLATLLAERVPHAQARPPQATYLAWVDLRPYVERGSLPREERPADVVRQRGGLWLAAGEDFGPVGAGHVRLNFATSPEMLDEIVDRLARGVGAR
ncbi:MAG: MalY/PatB family protein [Actinomycetes bacterium]